MIPSSSSRRRLSLLSRRISLLMSASSVCREEVSDRARNLPSALLARCSNSSSWRSNSTSRSDLAGAVATSPVVSSIKGCCTAVSGFTVCSVASTPPCRSLSVVIPTSIGYKGHNCPVHMFSIKRNNNTRYACCQEYASSSVFGRWQCFKHGFTSLPNCFPDCFIN